MFPYIIGVMSAAGIAGASDSFFRNILSLTPNNYYRLDEASGTNMYDSVDLPSRSNLVLGLHMDGTNGSTTFTDETSKTVTANGNAQISTAQSKFGGASGLFDGTGDYLSTAYTTDFEFKFLDFTIECWIRPTTLDGTNGDAIFEINGSSTSEKILRLIINTAGKISVGYSSDGTAESFTTGTTTISTATWTHVAVCRYNGTITVYVNGTAEDFDLFDNALYSGGTKHVYIGRYNNNTSADFNGYIDELLVYKGFARYIADFTPPARSFNTDLGTYVGTPAFSTASLLTGDDNTCILFDGSTDGGYLSLPSNLKVQTISLLAFINTGVASGGGIIISACPTGTASDARGFAILVNSSGHIILRAGDTVGGTFTNVTDSVDYRNSTRMVVGTYDGTDLRLYVDGELVASNLAWSKTIQWTDSGTGPTTGQLYVGAERDNTTGVVPNLSFFDGTIDEAVTFASTLTSKQINYIYRTRLVSEEHLDIFSILNTSTSIAYFEMDETSGNLDSLNTSVVATVNGSPTYSAATIYPIGTSITFNGSNTYFTADSIATTLKDLATSNYVNILLYFKTNASGGLAYGNILFSMHDSTGTSNLWRVGVSEANGGIFYTYGGDVTNGSGYNDNNWHSLAISFKRDGTGNPKLYVDGVDVYSTSPGTLAWSSAAKFTIGGEWDGGTMSDVFNGSIDRIFIGYRSTPWTDGEANRMII